MRSLRRDQVAIGLVTAMLVAYYELGESTN